MYTTMSLPEVIRTTHRLKSASLKRTIEFDIFMPQNLLGNEQLNLLMLNDGQEADALNVQQTLADLYASRKIQALVIVAVKSSEARLDEYGVAGIPDFGGRGGKAQAYSDFITKELLPFVQETVGLPVNGRRAFAGFSLGGLSAFDIAWNNDHYFDTVGVFSGAFWWSKKDIKYVYTDDDRIMHERIKNTKGKPGLRFWLMTGTEDETADRNKNFIIDSIDDTIDIIKELLYKGYKRPEEVTYYEKVGGKHDLPTWAAVFPAFLCWAFDRKSV
jgi:enterochelin esterase-like enzyme